MKIRQLEIEQFGIFQGCEFTFNGDGLQVIYGPNEAGKTTLLQLVREVLFGFALRNPYVFTEHKGDMAAVATCELADGSSIRFRRRKGRRNEVVGEHLGTGQQIDAPALHRLLGGASAELFQNVFGFSLAELGAGQQSLERAKLSEALYGGALGGLAGFQQVLDSLGKQHEAMYSPAATKKPINRLLSELRRQGKELRTAQVRPRDYEQLERELARVTERAEELRRQRDALHRDQMRCQQLVRAVELWRRRSLLIETLASLDVPESFPRDGQQRFEQYRALRDQAATELADFHRDLHEISTELSSLSPQLHLLDHATTIQQLAQQLDKIRGFRRDVVLRQQEALAIKTALQANLRELDPSWTLDHLQQFQTGIDRRTAISALQDEWEQLQQRQRDLLAQKPTLEADLQEIRTQLEAAPEETVATVLVELVESAAEYESRQERRELYQQQQREAVARAEALRRKLRAPFAELQHDLGQMPVPLPATVREFQEQLASVERQIEHGSLRLAQARQELAQKQQELAELHSADQVPDREQLRAARERRDAGWNLLRSKYVDRQGVSEDEIALWIEQPAASLPDAYQKSVHDVDQLADQRQRQAETVARMEQLSEAIAQCASRVQDEERLTDQSLAAREACYQEWRKLWEPSGISPESPAAMLDWLTLQSQLIDSETECDKLAGHIAAQQQWIDHYESQLAEQVGHADGTPEQQITGVRQRVKRAQESAADRKSLRLQLPRKQRKLAELEQDLTELEQQRQHWQERWQSLMAEVGFPAGWDVRTASQVLQGLSEARAQQREADSLDLRVSDMQQGLDQFEREVAALCQQLAPQLAAAEAENAVEELVEALDRTRHELQQQQTLAQQRARLSARCDAKQQQLTRQSSELARLLAWAQVDREEDVPEIARRASHRYEMQDELEGVEQQLRAIRGSDEPSEFESALVDVDQAELDSRNRILQTELEQVETLFNESLQAQGVARQRLQELDQASHAATLAQHQESTRSELAHAVDQWAPTVLAHSLMTHAIERFEREHQPQLLVEVGRLLEQMTLGRYREISRKLDEQGSLQIHQSDGILKEPHQLSTGTREQLYLAIRLAYVLLYCREAEPLPIIMDDVLVNFDDQRAAATLDTLFAISQQVQLILLTCHQYTLDLVHSRQPQLHAIEL